MTADTDSGPVACDKTDKRDKRASAFQTMQIAILVCRNGCFLSQLLKEGMHPGR